ncbi:hypothetical protein AMS68_000287 [Peltaster fructicola]|uniref:Uncharacterized protein n=1 Tax=Peltaster fructicola TaxID=286661 RepID=A0A6H0XJS2_9PEZI|nr:hypothetical protein AMS68_000287 [Peltaster fructicola]
MAQEGREEDPVPSSSALVEQKTLAQPDVSPIDTSDEAAQSRERSLSNNTRQTVQYGSQRVDQRPGSSGNPSIKGKGKRVNVDFAEPPTGDDRLQPVSPIEPPESSTRPGHVREDSYTNFSRPASVKRTNSKAGRPQAGPSNNNASSSLPVHSEDEQRGVKIPTKRSSKSLSGKDDMTALPTNPGSNSQTKQNRLSASTAGSRRLRPPIHQSDLERGEPTSSDESAPIPPFSQAVAEDHNSGRRLKDLPPPPSPWLRELYTISYLIFFSFLGTLARTGIEWLTFYPGAVIITPVVWANFAGSLIMGFLTEDNKMFQDEWAEPFTTPKSEKRTSKQSRISKQSRYSGRTTLSQDFERFQRKERAKIKKTVPLYTGLTTGFCGCFTSFSLFARDMFLALSNDTPSPINHPAAPAAGATAISTTQTLPRNGGYSFMAVVAVIITTLALSIGGFVAGQQLALLLERVTPRIPTKLTRLFLDRLVVVLAFGCWLGAIFLLIWPPDRPGGPLSAGSWANETWRGIELFSMVFCPVGCLIRYFASKKMNALEPSFPLGTFAVNMLGTAIIAVCYDIQRIGLGDSGVGGGLLGCQALEGIIDGFTGCLTTVSTLVAEIVALKRKYAWSYALSTIIGGLCLVVVIMGPVRWTIGWSDPVCITSYTNKY